MSACLFVRLPASLSVCLSLYGVCLCLSTCTWSQASPASTLRIFSSSFLSVLSCCPPPPRAPLPPPLNTNPPLAMVQWRGGALRSAGAEAVVSTAYWRACHGASCRPESTLCTQRFGARVGDGQKDAQGRIGGGSNCDRTACHKGRLRKWCLQRCFQGRDTAWGPQRG